MSDHREKISFLLALLGVTSKLSARFSGVIQLTEELAKKGLISGGFELTALEEISDRTISNYKHLTEEFLIDAFVEIWDEDEIDNITAIILSNPPIQKLFLSVGKMAKKAHKNAIKKVSQQITAIGIKLDQESKPLGFNDPKRKLTKKPLN
ncbi:MAG: hypothetical protein L3J07_02960 [Candidatus Magasanikbacteria bacterium]|nr:hypothetical protein [Candidatus Magasanikbacteria bacterium]